MRRLCLGLGLALAASGCGDSGGGFDAGSTFECGDAGVVTTAQIHAEILEARCKVCHSGDPQYPMNHATPQSAHQSIVGADSGYATAPGSTLKIVTPGDPQSSSLYLKVLGPPFKGPRGESVGTRMPLGQNPLEPAQIERIKSWICSGAPP